MKLLIITPVFPYPLESGGNKAQFLMIDKLRYDIDISLLCPKTSRENLAALTEIWPGVNMHVLSVTDNIPVKKKIFLHGVYVRLSNFFRHPLASVKRKAGLLPKSQPAALVWPSSKNMVFTNTDMMSIDPAFLEYVDQKVKSEKFDIIQVEFINLISLGFILPGDASKLFIHHEIGYIRTARETDTLLQKSIHDQYLFERNKAFELECLKQYDGVVTFSGVDKAELEKSIPVKVFNSPFPVENQPNINTEKFQIEKVIFLGGESHYPNLDGLHWFLSSFNWAENHSVKIKIIGRWSQAIVDHYKDLKYVEFLGFVDDLNGYLKNSVMIVPLRIGSGIRTKILEAFTLGVPVISTSIGIEGIPAVDRKHYFKADTIQEFEVVIEELTKNPSQAIEIAERSKVELSPLYEVDFCVDIRKKVYEDLLKS